MSLLATPPALETAAPGASETTPPPAAAPIFKDSLDRPFDAEKFRTDENGAPRLDKLGRFVNRRGGRKPKSPGVAQGAATAPAQTQPLPDAAPDFSAIAEALKASSSAPSGEDGEAGPAASSVENYTAETVIGIIQTALVLIGEDEGILSETEKTILRRPLLRVLSKYHVNGDAMPPEADLAVAVASLVIVRLRKPKTASAVVKIKTWFAGHFLAWRMRRAIPVAPSAP